MPFQDTTGAAALDPVLVVGGGVSGCAAAAALADAGRRVVLLTSALDTLGLPGYGPVLVASAVPGGEFVPVLQGLPAWYRPAWRDGLLCVEGRDDLGLIDRRLVAINTKWLLENHPVVDVRQGLVVAVRSREAAAGGGVEVETVFGEVFAGSACVLAVGLALGGRVRMGGRETPGGRLGEVAADALRDDLVGQRVRLVPTETSVGARIRWTGGVADLARALGGDARDLRPCPDAPQDSSLVALRPEGVPPLPEAGRIPTGCVLLGRGERADVEGLPPPGIWPDGAATGEWYASVDLPAEAPGGAVGGFAVEMGATSLPGLAVVRPAHVVKGEVLPSGDGFGPVPEVPGCYVAGQAAGARSYAASLRAGVRVARQVVEAVIGEAAGR